MSLFDPYSHTRIVELRQEQLARKAKRRNQLGLDESPARRRLPIAAVVNTLTARFSRASKPADVPAPAPTGQPALDS